MQELRKSSDVREVGEVQPPQVRRGLHRHRRRDHLSTELDQARAELEKKDAIIAHLQFKLDEAFQGD